MYKTQNQKLIGNQSSERGVLRKLNLLRKDHNEKHEDKEGKVEDNEEA
jgi:hypothetical protein